MNVFQNDRDRLRLSESEKHELMTAWQYRAALDGESRGRRISSPIPRPVVETRSRFATASRYTPLVIHGWFVLIVIVLWLVGVSPATLLYLSGSLAMLVYSSLGVMELRRAPLYVSPLSALFAWFFPPTGPCAIHYANLIADGEPILYSIRILHPDDIAAGYVVMLVGNWSFHAGLQWARPLVDSTTTSLVEVRPRLDGLLVLWAVSVMFRLAPGVFSSLGAISGVLHFGSTSALAAYLLSREPKKRDVFFWALALFGTLIEFITNLNSGSKAYLMFSFLPVLWLFLRDEKLRRFVPVMSVAMFTLYVSIIAPVVMASRTGQVDTRESAMNRIVRTYSRGDYEDDAGTDKQLPRYLERVFDATATGCIYSEVQRTGFMYGEGMEYMLYAVIPRVLWPDKPAMTRGAWFSEYLGQARTAESATTSLGQTAPGELYWNFGWIGIVVGMVSIGAVLGKLWKYATPFAERDSLRLLLYFGVTFQITDMSEAGSAILALIYRTLILGAAIMLVDRIWGSTHLSRTAHPLAR